MCTRVGTDLIYIFAVLFSLRTTNQTSIVVSLKTILVLFGASLPYSRHDADRNKILKFRLCKINPLSNLDMLKIRLYSERSSGANQGFSPSFEIFSNSLSSFVTISLYLGNILSIHGRRIFLGKSFGS